jgi:hypothetical protein
MKSNNKRGLLQISDRDSDDREATSWVLLVFIAISLAAAFLSLQFSSEKMSHHLFAVFFELALVLVVVEYAWRKHERRLAAQKRKDQLRSIKGVMFRKKMRDLFLADFRALIHTEISLSKIREASPETLGKWQSELAGEGYVLLCDDDYMPQVMDEYVKAESIWEEFKEFAITNGLDQVFKDI